MADDRQTAMLFLVFCITESYVNYSTLRVEMGYLLR